MEPRELRDKYLQELRDVKARQAPTNKIHFLMLTRAEQARLRSVHGVAALVFIEIKSWADFEQPGRKTDCYPSDDLIAKLTGYGESTVRKARNQLKSIGALDWRRN